MSEELDQLLQLVEDWPPEVQQKIMDAIRAFQTEYIDNDANNTL